MKFRYLIFECQEVVVDQESNQRNHIGLGFQRSAITRDGVIAEYHVYLEGDADLTKFSLNTTGATEMEMVYSQGGTGFDELRDLGFVGHVE